MTWLVLVAFGPTHERPALELLLATLHRVRPGTPIRTVVVDNARAGGADLEIDRGVTRISGDNTLREFSGWDRGLEWLERRFGPAPDSLIVLANDTVARPEKRQYVGSGFSRTIADCSIDALAGWVDEYPRPIELFGLVMRQWVDTSLVIASWRTLTALRPLARPIDDEAVFGSDSRHFFREPSPLSENYRTYLKTYFFGEQIDRDFVHGWYAQAPLAEHNFDAFKGKLRSVFCEHLLSARARAHGIPLVDIHPIPRPIDPPGVPALDPLGAAS